MNYGQARIVPRALCEVPHLFVFPFGTRQQTTDYTSEHGKDEIHFKDVKETKRLKLRGKHGPQEFMTILEGRNIK